MLGSTQSRAFSLTLIRHGQTTHNKAKIIQGQMETQLTDLGREQAKLLGQYFARENVSFDKYYSSDLIRAQETARIINKEVASASGQDSIIVSNLLRERCWGNLQGQTIEVIRKTAAEAGYDVSNLPQFRPEGGETLEDVHERIKTFCKNDLFRNANTGERIMIVSHGGVIREFMKIFRKFGCPLDQKDLIITQNTSINEFEVHLTDESRIRQIVPQRLHSLPHLTLDVLKNDSAGYEDGN